MNAQVIGRELADPAPDLRAGLDADPLTGEICGDDGRGSEGEVQRCGRTLQHAFDAEMAGADLAVNAGGSGEYQGIGGELTADLAAELENAPGGETAGDADILADQRAFALGGGLGDGRAGHWRFFPDLSV